jgi:hypothetical protein
MNGNIVTVLLDRVCDMPGSSEGFYASAAGRAQHPDDEHHQPAGPGFDEQLGLAMGGQPGHNPAAGRIGPSRLESLTSKLDRVRLRLPPDTRAQRGRLSDSQTQSRGHAENAR